MRTRLLAATTATVLAALAVPAGAGALDSATLSARLSALQKRQGARSSAMVVDIESRQILFQRRPMMRLAPASNEKLFVTAAALLRFGPSGTLKTVADAAPGVRIDRRGVLRGNLYLVGGGDPTLGRAGLSSLALQLKRRGLRRITGGVYGDESAFDRRRGGPDSGYAYDYYLGGFLSALSFSHGSARNGSPALTAATQFAAALKARGISYGRAPRTGVAPRGVAAGDDAPARPLATVSSPSMSRLAAAINVPSHNFYAEMLTKALGSHFGSAGTTGGGLQVVLRTLKPLGISPRLVDGSGLSRGNRTSARTLVTLLVGMDRSDAGAAFERSLPVAGRSGTLRHRMRGSAAARRCRAKTGTLAGVSSLSGYCTTRGGRRVAFALLENGVCSGCAKAVEDRMVAQIARLR